MSASCHSGLPSGVSISLPMCATTFDTTNTACEDAGGLYRAAWNGEEKEVMKCSSKWHAALAAPPVASRSATFPPITSVVPVSFAHSAISRLLHRHERDSHHFPSPKSKQRLKHGLSWWQKVQKRLRRAVVSLVGEKFTLKEANHIQGNKAGAWIPLQEQSFTQPASLLHSSRRLELSTRSFRSRYSWWQLS